MNRFRGARTVMMLTLMGVLLICSAWHASTAAALGIRVTGNHLTSLHGGRPIRLLGVNRAGAEYQCLTQGATSVFDGPTGAASIEAIKAWHANAVRIPLNEDCWLGINGTVRRLSGTSYRRAVSRYVKALNAAGLYVILDLHWSAPGALQANEQWPMADADHAPAFWRSVARTFRHERAVIFDLFNEPRITSWPCWKRGCMVTFEDDDGLTVTYRAAGMQRLVDAVRASHAANPIMIGGLNGASDDSEWSAYKPFDPDHQLIVSFHTYGDPGCEHASCWHGQTIASLALQMPVVTGEFGELDCADGYALAYMNWADAHGISYLGWAWNPTDSGWSCSSGPSLIVDYSGTPTTYGLGLQSHLAELADSATRAIYAPQSHSRVPLSPRISPGQDRRFCTDSRSICRHIIQHNGETAYCSAISDGNAPEDLSVRAY